MKYDTSVELFVIKDTVAEDIGPIFQAKNEKVAVREFRRMFLDNPHLMDFQLWRVGYLTKDMELIPEVHFIADGAMFYCPEDEIASQPETLKMEDVK